MQPFVLHAHFYQPERLNPWTGALDAEPSAAPYRDWNERILRECYAANGSARIYDSSGRVERIVNNYERLSFNYGPTLLSWMETAHPRAYARILDGDWRSVVRAGHGNALAQAYNHLILPLANDRDRRTQIHWGLADFRHRFGRDAEGMWLPETAADQTTIDALIDARVRFTVLAQRQAWRVRHRNGEWHEVNGAVDSTRPYNIAHSDGSGRSIAVFFYDGALAQSLAFDPASAETNVLVDRLAQAGGRDGLVSAALDGETFGHHHHFGELGLAYALSVEAPARGLEPTSYAAYLADHPAVDEAQILPGEGSSWSCAHGVGRWYRDCGCSTDALPGWNQEWRTPLRAALDIVRDAAIDAFEGRGAQLLRDPWAARDAYIDVRLGTVSMSEFVERHGRRSLTDAQKVDLRGLMEAQRNALLMYTSCGWFFADISGIETVYCLRFAARVLRLLRAVGVVVPEDEVLAVLAEAKSNKPEVGTGADVWHDQVEREQITPQRIAGHVGLLGLTRHLATTRAGIGHVVDVRDHRTDVRGRMALGTIAITVTSLSTGRRSQFAVAAMHLGGVDFHGVVARYPGDAAFASAAERIWTEWPTAPLSRMLRLLGEALPGEEFGLDTMLADGRQEVVGTIFSELIERFNEQYSRLYRDHRRILEMLTAAGLTLPRSLSAAAELTLSAELEGRLSAATARLGPVADVAAFEAVRDTVARARSQHYQLDLEPVARSLSAAVEAATAEAVATLSPACVDAVDGWLSLAQELGVDVDLTVSQELAYEQATRARAGRLGPDAVELVARLADRLGFAPSAWSASRP